MCRARVIVSPCLLYIDAAMAQAASGVGRVHHDPVHFLCSGAQRLVGTGTGIGRADVGHFPVRVFGNDGHGVGLQAERCYDVGIGGIEGKRQRIGILLAFRRTGPACKLIVLVGDGIIRDIAFVSFRDITSVFILLIPNVMQQRRRVAVR